jgi:hypothetical protein
MNQLRQLLQDELGPKYKDQDIEWVALAIVRFVYSKELRKAHGSNTNCNQEKNL